MDISRHPLLQQCYDAGIAVEALAACEKQTTASLKIAELLQSLNNSLSSPIPNVGEQWPEQGGINAGLMRGENGKPDYYIIIATDPTGKHNSLAYGGYDTEAGGANSKFDGQANTIALLKSGITHPAAEFAAGVLIEGHNDFYLPARYEQSVMYANCPELFDHKWHWSSTQHSAHNAWFQDFGDGDQNLLSKRLELAVRAVRRYYPLNNLAI